MPQKIDLKDLAAKVKIAIAAGQLAAEQVADGGTCNLDHVVLYLPRVRETAVAAAGIPARKGRAGCFHLYEGFGGQGARRTTGVEAAAESLKAAGVDCYIHYADGLSPVARTSPEHQKILAAIEVRALDSVPFSYSQLAMWAETRFAFDERRTRLVDWTIQKLRRRGLIAFERRGRNTVWTVVAKTM